MDMAKVSERPYVNTATAIRLRELHARGLSWRAMAQKIGYTHATLYNCATGRNQAGPLLERDVAQVYAQIKG